MRLPEKFNRKAVKSNFDKLSPATWDYLFDYEKDNGLAQCRTQGWGIRFAWYSVSAIKAWLLDFGYYTQDDFDAEGWPVSKRSRIPRGLKVTTHLIA